jgi:hypothetical protein
MAKEATQSDPLKARMEANYNIRDGERYSMYYIPESQLPLFVASKGDHGVDILPYLAGPNDPHTPQGEPTYCLDIYAHSNVGPGDEWFVCLFRNWKQPCPICEYRNQLMKNPPPEDADARTLTRHDDLVKALNAKRRVTYNIVEMTNQETEDKGVQVWEIAHFFMEKELQTLAGRGKARGKGYIFFAHPEEGKTVWFSRTGIGAKSTAYGGYAFEDRIIDGVAYVPRQEDLDAVFCLDEHIYIPTYDEVHGKFYDGQKVEEAGEDAGVRGTRRAATADQGEDEPVVEESVPQSRRPRPAPDAASQPEEEPRQAAARPRRTQDAAPAAEAAPASRRPSRPAPAASPAPRKLGKANPAAEPANDEGADPAGDRCPVPDGKFGIDADKFQECETCDHWDSCIQVTERRNQ